MRKIRAHPAKFIQELSNINWNTIYENEDMDVDDMVKYWSENIIKVLDKLAEKKSRQIGKNKKIQFPAEVQEKLKKLKEMKNKIDELVCACKVCVVTYILGK